jgi:hypothetical protein
LLALVTHTGIEEGGTYSVMLKMDKMNETVSEMVKILDTLTLNLGRW